MSPDTCSAPMDAHDGRDPQRYVIDPGHRSQRTTTLCAGCYAAAVAAGAEVMRERRAVERDERPEWVRRARARLLPAKALRWAV